MVIAGIMNHGYSSIVVTDIDGMQQGNVNYNYQTFRIL